MSDTKEPSVDNKEDIRKEECRIIHKDISWTDVTETTKIMTGNTYSVLALALMSAKNMIVLSATVIDRNGGSTDYTQVEFYNDITSLTSTLQDIIKKYKDNTMCWDTTDKCSLDVHLTNYLFKNYEKCVELSIINITKEQLIEAIIFFANNGVVAKFD